MRFSILFNPSIVSLVLGIAIDSDAAASSSSVVSRTINGVSRIPVASDPAARAESPVFSSQVVGYAHGKPFDDFSHLDAGKTHRRIAEVYFSGCLPGEHITLIGFGFRDNFGKSHDASDYSSHGVQWDGEKLTRLNLYMFEYITTVEVTTWKAKTGLKHKTRLGWIKITTSTGNSIQCGAKNPGDSIQTLSQQNGALLYFSGSAGDAVDSLQAHFIDVSKF